MKKFFSPLVIVAFTLLANTARPAETGSTKTYTVEYEVNLSKMEKEVIDVIIRNYVQEIASGNRVAYNFYDSTQVMSYNEMMYYCIKRDTFYVENPDPPYNLEMKVTQISADPLNDISGIRIKELWTVDQSGITSKKIIALAPLVFNYPICWIKLDASDISHYQRD